VIGKKIFQKNLQEINGGRCCQIERYLFLRHIIENNNVIFGTKIKYFSL